MITIIITIAALIIAFARSGARWDPEFERAYLFDGLTDQ